MNFSMNKAAFLDRDGVINRKARGDGYVTRWDEMHILPGVASAISSLNQSGFRVIVATNQRCVAKGLITVANLDALHERLCEALNAAGAIIDAVYFCPHEITSKCGCRKPAPGMLIAAANDHRVNLAESWMIGDTEIDVLTGKNAGCKTALLVDDTRHLCRDADIIASSLLEATGQILLLKGRDR
jgi:D-glycero-D-manno-heptose 1,7-bisphosphate phosphatase